MRSFLRFVLRRATSSTVDQRYKECTHSIAHTPALRFAVPQRTSTRESAPDEQSLQVPEGDRQSGRREREQISILQPCTVPRRAECELCEWHFAERDLRRRTLQLWRLSVRRFSRLVPRLVGPGHPSVADIIALWCIYPLQIHPYPDVLTAEQKETLSQLVDPFTSFLSEVCTNSTAV